MTSCLPYLRQSYFSYLLSSHPQPQCLTFTLHSAPHGICSAWPWTNKSGSLCGLLEAHAQGSGKVKRLPAPPLETREETYYRCGQLSPGDLFLVLPFLLYLGQLTFHHCDRVPHINNLKETINFAHGFKGFSPLWQETMTEKSSAHDGGPDAKRRDACDSWLSSFSPFIPSGHLQDHPVHTQGRFSHTHP
jgi:hypothetical protein